MSFRLPAPRLSAKRPVERWLDRLIWQNFRQEELRCSQRTALASFPRSGNTWARVLIEHATGLSSGTIYQRDQVFDACVSAGMGGVVVKTHELDAYRYNQAIVLVRNPFDAFESFYVWRRDSLGRVEVWERHVERCIQRWKTHLTYWTEQTYRILVVRYEDLRSNPEEQLSRMLDYLQLKVTAGKISEAVDQCQLAKLRKSPNASAFPNFFRRGNVGQGQETFSEELRQLMHDHLGPLLARFGYESDTPEKSPKIVNEHLAPTAA